MEVEVTTLTQRGKATMRNKRRLSADRIRIGRGTDSEIRLADIRVELAVAVLSPRDGRLAVEKLGVSPLRVNGQSTDSAEVKVGDTIEIGPCRIRIVEPPADTDVALEVELAPAEGNALNALLLQAQGLQRVALSKRLMSWSAFVVIAVVCLAVPIVLYSGNLIPVWQKGDPPAAGPVTIVALAWNAGELSNPHRFFAADCTSCHESSLRGVADRACLKCHDTTAAHVPPKADIGPLRAKLDGTACVECHEEHRGMRGTIIRSEALCLNCHSALAESAPKIPYRDVGGYPSGHPQFRATLVADPKGPVLTRVDVTSNPPLIDHPGLKFSHAVHLVKGGFPSLGYKQMACADCHVRDPGGGTGFLPVTYKGQCQGCHEHDLAFDNIDLPWPNAKVPHGDDVGVVAAVWNFYAGKAVQGTLAEPVSMRSPGGQPNPAQPAGALTPETRKLIASKTEAALNVILDPKRGCAYCHFGMGAQGAIDVSAILPADSAMPTAATAHFIAPVTLQSRFLPQSNFDHTSHAAMACGDCHVRRQSETTKPLTDLGQILATAYETDVVDIPGIETCQRCHGGEAAAVRAQSTCVTCHLFHRHEFGDMRGTAAVAH
jgi:predicted CXXCH cytochrome family protein